MVVQPAPRATPLSRPVAVPVSLESWMCGLALGIVDVVGCRPMTREDLVAVCCEDYEDEMYGFAWELVSPREVVPVPVKGIVAPWPWRGPELTLCPGWHDRNVLDD